MEAPYFKRLLGFHTLQSRYGRVWNMSQFAEFDMPVVQPKATADEVRQRFPEMSKVIDEFEAVFGINQVKVHMVEEGNERIETSAYKKQLTYKAISGMQFIRMGEISAANAKHVNRDKHGRK